MKSYLRRVGQAAQLNPRAFLRRAYCEVTAEHMAGHFRHCGYGHGVLEKPTAERGGAATATAVAAAAAVALAVSAAATAAAVSFMGRSAATH